jgi:nitroreductase
VEDLRGEGPEGKRRSRMDIEALLEVMRKRRHNGRVKADPIPEAHVRKLVEAASWAPSGNNSQPWEFIVVKNPEAKNKIREIMEGPARPGATHAPAVDPPAIIVVCGDVRLKDSYPESVNRQEVFYASLAAALQNLHLAATALGLATSWGTVREAAMEPLRKLLDLPDELEIVALVRAGYPQDAPAPKPRRPVEEAMHLDRYDRARLRDVKSFIESYGKGWGRL